MPARTARADAGAAPPLLVIVEVGAGGAGDAGEVRRAIRAELGEAIAAPNEPHAAEATRALLVGVDRGHVSMLLQRDAATALARRIPVLAERGARLLAIAWLARNMVRDQVAEPGGWLVTALVIPGAPPARAPAESSDRVSAERAAYARAHVAHFDGTSWSRALTAWEDYLRPYPRGTFAPEARFNRTLCLIRLGRFEAAKEALRPFAAGAVGRGYRATEARTLLDWIDRAR